MDNAKSVAVDSNENHVMLLEMTDDGDYKESKGQVC
jgi:hypothetical protein